MTNELGTSGLRLERDGVIAWCVIDRPHAKNAFTPVMYFGIKRAVRFVNHGSDEPREAMRAFIEKRRPSWIPT